METLVIENFQDEHPRYNKDRDALIKYIMNDSQGEDPYNEYYEAVINYLKFRCPVSD